MHLQGAALLFTPRYADDHFCYRVQCRDVYMLITDAAHPGHPRAAALSRIRTFPNDVNERRRPFDLHSTVLEGQVHTATLYPEVIQSLRQHGLPVDGRTVVFDRRALEGRVPPAESVDVAVPWLVGLPVAMALMSVAGRWSPRRTGQVP